MKRPAIIYFVESTIQIFVKEDALLYPKGALNSIPS